MTTTSRRGFAKPALPGCVTLVIIGGLVLVLALWASTSLPDPSGTQKISAAIAPPRIVVGPGEIPVLFHGEQTLVIPSGATTGCMKPAPGDSRLTFRVNNTRRSKCRVTVWKECDVGEGILVDCRDLTWDKQPMYAFRVENTATETVSVTTWSW